MLVGISIEQKGYGLFSESIERAVCSLERTGVNSRRDNVIRGLNKINGFASCFIGCEICLCNKDSIGVFPQVIYCMCGGGVKLREK